MAKLPDRKLWDKRTGSYMTYPGIEPVRIKVGSGYELVFVELAGDEGLPVRR
jgi:hypothetical protein